MRRAERDVAAHLSASHGLLVALMLAAASVMMAGGGVVVAEAARDPAARQRLKVQRHLKGLNKTPVKTIQSPDGDIIDCVHISNQPAFDHPLLKNHTIQMRPASFPEELFGRDKAAVAASSDQKKAPSIAQLWHQNGMCPEDTIPIRRTMSDDLLRARTIKSYGKKHRTVPNLMSATTGVGTRSSHLHAIVYVEGDKYYGAKATMNVWQPMVRQHSDEFSLSQLWILGGSLGDDLNTIEAGWQVYPHMYGDNNTRLFVYWTSDNYRSTGCYNLLCAGFIQTNKELVVGATISPISSYSGDQYDISIVVWKEPTTGNWWLKFGNDSLIGYWPSAIFSRLSDSASLIEWGGEVVNSVPDGKHTSTQMGSGHFPEEGFGKASYFKNLEVVDESYNLKPADGIATFTPDSNCYNAQNGISDDWGNYFYYGGPGRNPNCE